MKGATWSRARAQGGSGAGIAIGKVLLMFTHGDGIKFSELDRMMSREERILWGECLHHEIHTGHYHHEKVLDQKGVLIRALPSLCKPDGWHAKSGYIGSKERALAFLWHPERGLTATFHTH